MLKQITIKNFAIFEDASFEPGEGYNVITGESGAGKSIIVNALSLIRGARAYREMIRTGKDYAVVEAVFELSDDLLAETGIEDNILVITRKIHNEKVSECRINDKIRPLSDIVEITGRLLDIHGQYENQTLADSSNHISFLDSFAGEELLSKIDAFNLELNEYNDLVQKIIKNSGSEADRERNKEIYSFQLNEIDAAGLLEISEEALMEKWNFMKNAEKFMKETEKAYEMLGNDINSPYDIVSEVQKILASLPDNNEITSITEKLNEASFILLDSLSGLRDFIDNNTFDEYEYDEISDTIENIKKLKRKYGNTIDDILEYRNKIALELENIENFEANNRRSLEKIASLEKILLSMDEELTILRKKYSKGLREKLLSELYDMSMVDADFLIDISTVRSKNSMGFTEFRKNGNADCEFLITLNKGLAPQPLARVASGGEMSRIMLALKTIFAFRGDTETVIFDEIDSGLSGEASRTVASKLKKLSGSRQIICITHLPQIAARKGNHFVIWKNSFENDTKAWIRQLKDESEIIRQIAALTDGDNPSDEALMHARQLFSQYN